MSTPLSDDKRASESDKKDLKKRCIPNKIGSTSLDPKNFSGEMIEMNGHLFQTIDERKDATQYTKTAEALERFAFKTYNVDINSIFQRENPELPKLEIPTKPNEEEIEISPAKQDIYKLKLKDYIKDEKVLKNALKLMFAVIWGQCSNSIRTKLEKKTNMQDIKIRGC